MTPTPFRRTALLVALAALLAPLLAGLAGLGAPASAIPSGGASPNTPGTSSAIPTRSVSVGGTIQFQVGGFPAGETLYVKIDDERYCQAPPFGACVYHQQKIGANGSVRGSFTLPAGLAPGAHFLRFLASEETDAGLKGYTRKSPSFTVTAASGSGSTGGSGASGGSGSAGGSGTTGSGTTGADGTGTGATTDNGAVVPDTGGEGVVLSAPGRASAAPSASAEAAPQPAALVATPTQAQAADEDRRSMPWIGLYVLLGCLLASSVLTTVALFRRR